MTNRKDILQARISRRRNQIVTAINRQILLSLKAAFRDGKERVEITLPYDPIPGMPRPVSVKVAQNLHYNEKLLNGKIITYEIDPSPDPRGQELKIDVETKKCSVSR
jgi:hypothetical protein